MLCSIIFQDDLIVNLQLSMINSMNFGKNFRILNKKNLCLNKNKKLIKSYIIHVKFVANEIVFYTNLKLTIVKIQIEYKISTEDLKKW